MLSRELLSPCHNSPEMEWLESDGLGGFAMGNAVGIPSRRYHSILTSAIGSPASRFTLINALNVRVVHQQMSYSLSSFQFQGGLIHPDGISKIIQFKSDPWPTWTFQIDEKLNITFELFMIRFEAGVYLRWSSNTSNEDTKLIVRPLLSGRSYHALHRENTQFNFAYLKGIDCISWKPYDSLPRIYAHTVASYQHDPLWFRSINYEEDRLRGSDFEEDLASPGEFIFNLSEREAWLAFIPKNQDGAIPSLDISKKGKAYWETSRDTSIESAADSYIVKRGDGYTIIAGYPWFADWGRDTFISIRGLVIARGNFEIAGLILLEWSKVVSEGMLPNRFLEFAEAPEYNSVDAALWFIISAYDFFEKIDRNGYKVSDQTRRSIESAIKEILESYTKGTRYNIKCDSSDGLLAAGIPGQQLTWMDAKIGDYVVTPRIGKPIEIQALWINALEIGAKLFKLGAPLLKLARESFKNRFFEHKLEWAYDVIDCDHIRDKKDYSLRPNQIFAVGGLPFQVISGVEATKIVNAVEKHLLTPFGLRTLAPFEKQYHSRYLGVSYDRDSAYHQGTVWPWLMGAFVEAWVRIRGSSIQTKSDAKDKFLTPLLDQLDNAGLAHLSEIHDGDFPHVSRGCPFQAWSLAEAIRLKLEVLV